MEGQSRLDDSAMGGELHMLLLTPDNSRRGVARIWVAPLVRVFFWSLRLRKPGVAA